MKNWTRMEKQQHSVNNLTVALFCVTTNEKIKSKYVAVFNMDFVGIGMDGSLW